MRKEMVFISAICCAFSSLACNQTSELSREEIFEKLAELDPQESDLVFDVPEGWSNNLLADARVIYVTDGENIDSANKAIDGLPLTIWKSNNYQVNTEIIFDLQVQRQFNKLVVYNLHTDARGSGGGNNALKQFQLFISNESNEKSFVPIGEFTLTAPKEVCFSQKGGGHICAFINNKKPDVFDLDEINASTIKIVLQSAYWKEAARDEWKSFALSEIMLFHSCRD